MTGVAVCPGNIHAGSRFHVYLYFRGLSALINRYGHRILRSGAYTIKPFSAKRNTRQVESGFHADM